MMGYTMTYEQQQKAIQLLVTALHRSMYKLCSTGPMPPVSVPSRETVALQGFLIELGLSSDDLAAVVFDPDDNAIVHRYSGPEIAS